MQRKKKEFRGLPDLINASLTKNFTQVPNILLRNRHISGKAKAILCLLLSNKEGWKSHVITLTNMMKESKDAIYSGLQELEKHGYLIRVKCRVLMSKKLTGEVWAYTDLSNSLNMAFITTLLEKKGLEMVAKKTTTGFSRYGKSASNNINNKKKGNYIKNNLSLAPLQNKEYLSIARKLSTIVRKIKNIKHTYSQLGAWSNHIRLLVEKNKVSVDRIYEALKWYSKHHADKYTPIIESGESLRNKFIKLEDAIKRDSESNYLSKVLSVAELHEQIKNRMNGARKDTVERMIVMFDNVCDLSPNSDKVTLINNLNNLYLSIIESRPVDAMEKSHHGEDIGTPIYLIEEYYQWLKDETWISDINENTITFKSKLFKKFLNHFGDEIGLDPLTGDYK